MARRKNKQAFDPFRRHVNKNKFILKKIADLKDAVYFLNKVQYNIELEKLNTLLIVLSVAGFVAGIIFKNLYLSFLFAFAVPMMVIEFILIKKEAIARRLDMDIIKYSELIKNTYLSTHSIKDSVAQNMHRFREPIRTIFKELLYEIEIFNYYPEDALRNMAKKLDSPSLNKLVEQLILCNRDQRFDSSLSAMTMQLNDRRQFLQRWQFIAQDVIKKFIFMMVVTNGLVVFTFVSYAEMGEAFLNSGISKIIIAIYAALQIFALFSTLRKVNQVKV